MQRCTLTTIARAAGVGVSTVSYALRGDAKIPAETAQRIRATAARLGYRTNPAIANLMAHIRASRLPRSRERMAFVWIEADKEESRRGFNAETLRGAKARAFHLGYDLREFWLRAGGFTARRLSSILKAQGISGVVFSGCERETAVQLDMDWASHASAIVGNAPWTPELHRAGHNHYLATKRVMEELQRRGYRRPAAILDAVANQRASRAPEAAFSTFHPDPAAGRELLRFQNILEDKAAFRKWLRTNKADAIVLAHPYIMERITAIDPALIERCGFVALDLVENAQNLSGILMNDELVAASAVDLVIGQLHRNESGIPKNPQRLLVEGAWYDGALLRAATVPAVGLI